MFVSVSSLRDNSEQKNSFTISFSLFPLLFSVMPVDIQMPKLWQMSALA
jgi:hypothetical protein